MILYGCGDFVNDYEGTLKKLNRISLAPDLGLIYLARFAAADGRLRGLEMHPIRMRRLQVRRAGDRDAMRLAALMNREGAEFDTQVTLDRGTLKLTWQDASADAPGE